MLINIQNLFKTYRMGDTCVHALEGVSLEVTSRDFVAVMGSSGSGKSTLLNILGCLDTPTSGNYLLDDISVKGMSRKELAHIRNLKLGFVFQNFNLLSRTSALENVELPTFYNHHFTSRTRHQRAKEMLARVGLEDRMTHTPSQLSGGQQQRVAIARALMNNPPIILADEPTGNLDTQASAEIMALFKTLNSEGITIVMVTHEEDIATCAKHRIIMRDGKIIGDNPTLTQAPITQVLTPHEVP